MNNKAILFSGLFTEEVGLVTQLSAKWRELGKKIPSFSSLSQMCYFKKNIRSSKCFLKLYSRFKEAWRIFNTKAVLIERHSVSFSNVRWIFFLNNHYESNIGSFWGKKSEQKLNKQKRKPSKDVFGRLQFLTNCWIPLKNRKQPN